MLDISDPANPRIAAQLPLANTVFGPPTNLQITPDGRLGLVANSIVSTEKDGIWAVSPDDTMDVLDMTAQPPKLLETIKVGRQPSGLSISSDGHSALVANRAGKSVSLLRIDGTSVKQVAEVALPDQAAAVVFRTGRQACLRGHEPGRHCRGAGPSMRDSVTYDKTRDIPTGPGVYNVDITPDGRTVVAANTATDGNGSLTTLALIDATGANPHVVGFTAVPQGPEGAGDLAGWEMGGGTPAERLVRASQRAGLPRERGAARLRPQWPSPVPGGGGAAGGNPGRAGVEPRQPVALRRQLQRQDAADLPHGGWEAGGVENDATPRPTRQPCGASRSEVILGFGSGRLGRE